MPLKKDRVIIDTNLWISFLLTKDFARLDDIIASNRIVLLFSQELLDEFIEVAGRPKFKKYFSIADLRRLLTQINLHAVFVEVESNIEACRDKKDNFLLSLATDGKATHLLTGDKDLLELQKIGSTNIITISAYLTGN